MKLAYLKLGESAPECREVPGHSVACFPDIDTFLQSAVTPEGVIIGGGEPDTVEHVIRQIRAAPFMAILPVVLLNDPGSRLALLSDGVAADIAAAVARMVPVRERLQELPQDVLDHGQDFRLLAYLYCRPDARLRADRQWNSARVYTYPAVEALADPTTDVDRWLSNLVERDYLERADLIDRLRLCPKCGGPHQNYVDACPHSRSIDIVQKPFLHCFTCGNVGPEETFLAGGALVCPKCATRLRHIGADYDRPLENYLCNECGQSFVEPLVIARCLTCGAENPTEALVPRQVYALRLSERGRLAARTGSLEDIYALFDNLNYTRPQFFEALVDWLLAVCRRHTEERFSLLGIRLRNVLDLTDRIGRFRTAEVVDEFAARLRETVRKTDLSTRTDQRTLWILLPKTECPACTILLTRLEEIRKNSRQPEGIGLEFDVVTFSAPTDMLPEETSAVLLARLISGLE